MENEHKETWWCATITNWQTPDFSFWVVCVVFCKQIVGLWGLGFMWVFGLTQAQRGRLPHYIHVCRSASTITHMDRLTNDPYQFWLLTSRVVKWRDMVGQSSRRALTSKASIPPSGGQGMKKKKKKLNISLQRGSSPRPKKKKINLNFFLQHYH